MELDLKPYFNKLDAVVNMADSTFERILKEFPEQVKCEIKCADCCHALFDITLIEAIHINYQFNQKFNGKARNNILEKANRADRKVYQIKRKAYKEMTEGKSEEAILMELALERCRCPLLNEKDLCDLYEHRPITCRLYGIPTSIGGAGHTCGMSGFQEGQTYPSVNLDAVQQWLFQISQELVDGLKSKHSKMADMLIPLSMALLADYDAQYLGVPGAPEGSEEKGKTDE